VKLHAAGPSTYNTITAYGADYVQVNAQRYQSSLIVLAEKVLDWPVEGFDRLSEESFSLLTNEKPEIVLLGTGPKQRFPHPRLTAALAQAGVGIEVMDLKAACRTYNVLVAEERKVAAALLFRCAAPRGWSSRRSRFSGSARWAGGRSTRQTKAATPRSRARWRQAATGSRRG
jgi:uncharacterized protein